MYDADDIYNIALTLIPDLKFSDARKLVEVVGSSRFIFENANAVVNSLKSVSKKTAAALTSKDTLKQAEYQLNIVKQKNIILHYFKDENFPKKLLQCYDCPILMYSYNDINFNDFFTIAIVGTRSADDIAKNFIYTFVNDLKNCNRKILIVSGLAEGADTFAHNAALEFNMPTVAVLGHGLDHIYPQVNRTLANNIFSSNGILLTEFYWDFPMSPDNFLQRNRIIAGLCDVVIVVQSGIAGGSLNTAELAIAYNRDVFAVPGRFNDELSLGCNNLIRNNKAAILTNFQDFEYYMGW